MTSGVDLANTGDIGDGSGDSNDGDGGGDVRIKVY
jgi:hypothetical protein